MTDMDIPSIDVFVDLNPNSLEVVIASQDDLNIEMGVPGPPGESATNSRWVAGEALGGHRMVALVGGVLVYADQSNPSHMGLVRGMTIGAAAQGALATVVKQGEIVEPTWNYTPNKPLYLGTNGLATTLPPNSGFVLEIGQTVDANRIFIQIGQAFLIG